MNTDILIEYLEGKLNEEDTKLVEAWIEASADNRKIVNQLCELLFIHDRVRALEEYDESASYNVFKKSVNLNNKKRRKTYSILKRVATVAAVAILFLLIGTVATIGVLDKIEKTISIHTNLGERAHVSLPDGSNVWLNACSSLEYKRSLLTRKRVATVEGEGYFEVAHNKAMPFIVQNNNAEIRVLGTHFNVRSNNDEVNLVVSLLEGAINFNDNYKADVTLRHSERLVYNKLNKEFSIEHIIPDDNVTAWMQGRIIFDNTPLEEMARTLEKHYNVKIRFLDDTVKQKRFTAEFGMSDNIYQIFSILDLTNTFDYTINEREIQVKSITE